MDLLTAKTNQSYVITNFQIEDKHLQRRLNEFGIITGKTIKVLKFSPRKKTLLISLLGTAFALKSEIAKQILVDYE